jgi:hypothetical protein
MEYHFLSMGSDDMQRFLAIVTLGTISWFGQYRCVCCGKARIGKIDGPRRKAEDRAANGKSSKSWNPIDWWLNYRDSWEQKKRRHSVASRMRRSKSKKKYRHKPFRKKTW